MTNYRFLVTGAGIVTVILSVSHAEVPFAPPQDISRGSVSGITSLVAGDIDGDGRADVITIEGGKHADGRRVFAWFQAPTTAGGSWLRHEFQTVTALRPFLGAADLSDMDGDGDLDLVLSSDMHSGDRQEADLFVLVNPLPQTDARGIWTTHRINKAPLPVHHINDMEIADLDGDGRADIICRSLSPNQIHIFFQNEMPSFEHKKIDTRIEQSEGLAVGLLDRDAMPDITFTGIWLRAPANPRVDRYERLPIDSDYAKTNQNTKESIGDIDGDGRLDVVIGPAEAYRGGKDHYLAWYRNTGKVNQENWPRRVIQPETNNNHTVALGDVDGDGDLDVVTGIPWPREGAGRSVRIFYNDGHGKFGDPQLVARDKGLYTGVLADVDNDGALDLIGQDTYARESKPWLYRNMRLTGRR